MSEHLTNQAESAAIWSYDSAVGSPFIIGIRIGAAAFSRSFIQPLLQRSFSPFRPLPHTALIGVEANFLDAPRDSIPSFVARRRNQVSARKCSFIHDGGKSSLVSGVFPQKTQ